MRREAGGRAGRRVSEWNVENVNGIVAQSALIYGVAERLQKASPLLIYAPFWHYFCCSRAVAATTQGGPEVQKRRPTKMHCRPSRSPCHASPAPTSGTLANPC